MYSIFNDQSLNDTLTNNIVSFEQLGPDFLHDNVSYLLIRGGSCKNNIFLSS